MMFIWVNLLLLTSLSQICLAETWRDYGILEEELKQLNVTCPDVKTCLSSSTSFRDRCECERFCVRFGTCCFDSSYLKMRAPKIKPTCRSINNDEFGFGYFMVSECPQNGETRSAYDDLCREDANDLMRLTPVTSAFTHITYKNYFCFLCHEKNDDYIFWNIDVGYNGETNVKQDDPNFHVLYDDYYNYWVAPVGEGGRYCPVSLDFVAHSNISYATRYCQLNIIAECSADWPNDVVREKCYGYTLVIDIERDEITLKYKNPHCAMCNYEDLENQVCRPADGGFGGGGKIPFSFTFLLDVNPSDGDKVGRIQRCASSEVWDPFFERCRAVTCAIPGYVVRDGRCVRA